MSNLQITPNTTTQWLFINNWIKDIIPTIHALLNPPASIYDFEVSENLINCKLPDDFIELYSINDGQRDGVGAFFGMSFLTIKEIIVHVKSVFNNYKPSNRKESDPVASETIVQSILDIYKQRYIKLEWVKIKFFLSPNSRTGPDIYIEGQLESLDYNLLEEIYNENKEKNKILDSEIYALTSKLHFLEKMDYNCDEIDIVMVNDNSYTIERKDFFKNSDFTSLPPNKIKLQENNPL